MVRACEVLKPSKTRDITSIPDSPLALGKLPRTRCECVDNEFGGSVHSVLQTAFVENVVANFYVPGSCLSVSGIVGVCCSKG